MIELKSDTLNHSLEYTYDHITRTFENVMTIKTHDNYYEVLQKQNITEKNAPLLRVPISNTILEFNHE